MKAKVKQMDGDVVEKRIIQNDGGFWSVEYGIVMGQHMLKYTPVACVGDMFEEVERE